MDGAVRCGGMAGGDKVLVTPTWKIEGAVAKVEACNNGFDAVPAWEDITAMVQINRVYNFINKTKTASKWGVNIRFTITKNEGFEGEVSISGFGVLQTKVNRKNEKSPAKFTRPKMGITKQAGEKSHRQPG